MVHEPDANEDATRVVEESVRLVRDAARALGAAAVSGKAAPEDDLEAAWKAWSAAIQGCDERTMTLLRAAFEAGMEAAKPREK